MEEKKITYYLIFKRIIGKREKESGHIADYLFQDGKWVHDEESKIMDHLVGFDPHEPADSPYVIGNLSIMDKIEEISYEEVMRRIREDKEKEK